MSAWFSGCCGHNSGTKVDRFFGEIVFDSPMVDACNGTIIINIGLKLVELNAHSCVEMAV